MTLIRLHIAAFLAAGVFGCIPIVEENNFNAETPDYEFGDPYMLHQRDGLPYLQGDSLVVEVSYTGCGGEAFSLESFRTGPSSYDIWLYMEERTFTCQAEITQVRAFKVSDEVRAAQSVQLVTPEGKRIELVQPSTGGNDIVDFRFLASEILVDLKEGYTRDHLDSLLEHIEPMHGSFFFPNIHRVVVPVGEEKYWADLLRKEEIIRATDLNRFGFSYGLVEDDGFPRLEGDSLFVWVWYGGCSPDHDFTLWHSKGNYTLN